MPNGDGLDVGEVSSRCSMLSAPRQLAGAAATLSAQIEA